MNSVFHHLVLADLYSEQSLFIRSAVKAFKLLTIKNFWTCFSDFSVILFSPASLSFVFVIKIWILIILLTESEGEIGYLRLFPVSIPLLHKNELLIIIIKNLWFIWIRNQILCSMLAWHKNFSCFSFHSVQIASDK